MSHFQEFPKMLFKKDAPHVTVHTHKEEDEHVSKGYSATPHDAVVDRGDKVNYAKQHEPSDDEKKEQEEKAKTEQVAEPKKVVVVKDATEQTGASAKQGANVQHGVLK